MAEIAFTLGSARFIRYKVLFASWNVSAYCVKSTNVVLNGLLKYKKIKNRQKSCEKFGQFGSKRLTFIK